MLAAESEQSAEPTSSQLTPIRLTVVLNHSVNLELLDGFTPIHTPYEELEKTKCVATILRLFFIYFLEISYKNRKHFLLGIFRLFVSVLVDSHIQKNLNKCANAYRYSIFQIATLSNSATLRTVNPGFNAGFGETEMA